MLGWNPTEPVQVEGRLWRQGNKQKKVHIVYPLMYNSLDSLIYQKHDEKASRIDAIWDYRGDKINVEEINPAELKFDLIKSPEMKADIILEQKAIPLKRELKIIEESKSLIDLADQRIIPFKQQIDDLQTKIKEIKKETEEALKKNEKMPKEFLRLTNIMISNSQEEQNTLEQAIAKKQKSIATIKANLSKKMGPEYKDKENCLIKLSQKQTQIEAQIALLQEERTPLIEQFKSQYAKQEAQQKTVEQLVDEMVGVVLGEEK